MIIRATAIVSVFLILAGMPAFAQFGPERETPRKAAEILADRAMEDAARLLRTGEADVLDADAGVDIEQANNWYAVARKNYAELCADRTAPRDQWARNCYKLADIYRRGLGLEQNYDEAETLYLAACYDGQHTPSCLQQAYIDHTGPAGSTDWPAARGLYQTACNRGDLSGCAGLGNMLYRGQGGLPDRERGAVLLQDSCVGGYDWACERLTGFGLTRERFR